MRMAASGRGKQLSLPIVSKQVSTPAPDIFLVDMQHVTCHMAGTPLTSVKTSSAVYPVTVTEQVLVFDSCHNLSATDHERVHHAGKVPQITT